MNDDFKEPPESLVKFTHLIYALHTASIVIGISTSATVIGAFVFGIPSIIAVILNYARRGEARGTYLESHFRWQIRTFWFAMLWGGVSVFLILLLAISVVGLLLVWLPVLLVGGWVIYRIIRGWLALNDGRDVGV